MLATIYWQRMSPQRCLGSRGMMAEPSFGSSEINALLSSKPTAFEIGLRLADVLRRFLDGSRATTHDRNV